MGLFDYEFQLDKIKAHQPPLQKLNQIIDWEIFREPIEKALYKKPKSNAALPKYYPNHLLRLPLTIQPIHRTTKIRKVITSSEARRLDPRPQHHRPGFRHAGLS